MIVRFHLHQCMSGFCHVVVNAGGAGNKPRRIDPLHDRGIVRIRHHRTLRMTGMCVAHHAEQRFRLRLAVDNPVSIENFVPAMFRIGLREHHQFDVCRITLHALEIIKQIIDFVFRQGQPKFPVGRSRAFRPLFSRLIRVNACGAICWNSRETLVHRMQDGFGHPIMKERRESLMIVCGQCLPGTRTQVVHHSPLYTFHRPQSTTASDLGGFGGPGRNGTDTAEQP